MVLVGGMIIRVAILEISFSFPLSFRFPLLVVFVEAVFLFLKKDC